MHPIPVSSPADLIACVESVRASRNISQRNLCNRAAVSHSCYWYALDRGSDISLSVALRYLDALGLQMQIVEPVGVE